MVNNPPLKGNPNNSLGLDYFTQIAINWFAQIRLFTTKKSARWISFLASRMIIGLASYQNIFTTLVT